MRLTSIIAIFFLFWALSFFLVLPFRLQRRDSVDAAVHGEMPGAQGRFSFGRTCGWTTIVAAILFGLYYGNYVYQWVPVETFDFVPAHVIEGNGS
ncbi:putative secreted protein [Sphingomonas vulcanisoli]|uniref:Secreted protein n=1 Tax=Sphingomonas vulcanisoli TaxID=1658060 RepID=A0ABX0TYF4_9SPHN|nr:DUF1467 family protein [Sphingomonas vulcanisoli]NIJ08666.1 putative secreted protein [Sphingomonas vulcanisoli]